MEHFKESTHIKKDIIISSSSEDMVEDDDDDASSGPLYNLADLMNQLPIKRGLSKFYNEKSQAFASLLNLKNNEDLGKKEIMWSHGIRGRMRGNENKQRYIGGPKNTITKRSF